MQNRKKLSLEEVLKLDRRPTLQEMVDLSVEDYTKYLYKKGIIKYIPESGNLEDYMPVIVEELSTPWHNSYDYKYSGDVNIEIRDPQYDMSVEDYDEDLNDPEDYKEMSIVEEGVLYFDNKEYKYFIDDDEFVYFYKEDSKGNKIIKDLNHVYR